MGGELDDGGELIWLCMAGRCLKPAARGRALRLVVNKRALDGEVEGRRRRRAAGAVGGRAATLTTALPGPPPSAAEELGRARARGCDG